MLRRLVPLVVPWVVCHAAAQDVDMGTGADCALTPPPALTRVEALRRLRACNRDLRAARRTVSGAAADVQVASQAPNPTATIGVGTYNWALGVGPGALSDKTVDTSVRIEQVVERGGKLELRKRGAESLAAAARDDASDVERQQGTAMLQAMVDLAAARARVAVLEELLQLYEETVRANARRLAQGDIARIDAQRQLVEAGRARTDLTQARSDVQRARLALAVLLGWEGEAGALGVDPAILDELQAPPRAVTPEERADVRAARNRVDAAAAARELARAQQKPDVTVGLQYDHFPTSPTNTLGTGNTIGVSVQMPLHMRHGFEGEIARATNDFYAAQDTLAKVTATARSDDLRIAQDLEAARMRLDLLEKTQAPQVEDVLRGAETGYARGAIGVLDVLDARRTARQVRLDILAARADAARAALARWWWAGEAGK